MGLVMSVLAAVFTLKAFDYVLTLYLNYEVHLSTRYRDNSLRNVTTTMLESKREFSPELLLCACIVFCLAALFYLCVNAAMQAGETVERVQHQHGDAEVDYDTKVKRRYGNN
jgi:hypothetical protein